MPPRLARGLAVALATLALLAPARHGLSGDDPNAADENAGPRWWPPPISAGTARTWITLHETTIRPLPDRTPLRDVLRAIREATRGKGQEIDIRIKNEVLWEAELTMNTPIASPFAGQTEVPVDTYLKYLLRQFVLERYVHDGFVTVDGPCDDCEGYATVSAAEAHSWLLLQQGMPLKFARPTPLGEVIQSIAAGTRGRGFQGRGLVISAAPWLLKEGIWSKRVTIVAEDVPVGASLARVLQPHGLAFRVLSDGNLLIVSAPPKMRELDEHDEQAAMNFQVDWHGDFPLYRSTYSELWQQYVKECQRGAKAAPVEVLGPAKR